MKAACILIFVIAIVSSFPIYSSKDQQDIPSTAKATQRTKSEKDKDLLCGQSNAHCLRMSGLGKSQLGARFGGGGLGRKAMDKVSGAIKSLKTLIDTRKARNDF
ncbi:hypothetical protein DSO57_1014654 [Entomophthora muscae]|uniref:Uncharacterized protein n=1 Tax=Entomophthora muscae TaxID=34485 RepID=A0ACC2S764_9FUNG|nr:hypothetical protein DSO57_1014654 [Entomophthora muscae]